MVNEVSAPKFNGFMFYNFTSYWSIRCMQIHHFYNVKPFVDLTIQVFEFVALSFFSLFTYEHFVSRSRVSMSLLQEWHKGFLFVMGLIFHQFLPCGSMVFSSSLSSAIMSFSIFAFQIFVTLHLLPTTISCFHSLICLLSY